MVVHPSSEIPQLLVDKIFGRRGKLHMFDSIDPVKSALVVVDFDSGSCAREYSATETPIENVNLLAETLKGLGGTVAYVTSEVTTEDNLEAKIGRQRADQYIRETTSGGVGTVLDERLKVESSDLRSVKRGASAFFPGKCDLHEQLKVKNIEFLLIAGLVTNVCCESSARDACELGYKTTMVSDALLGHSYGLHEASLSTFFRIFGDVRPTNNVIKLIEGF